MVKARRIIDYMKRRTYTPVRARALARALGVDREEYQEFRQALRELHKKGLVVRRGGGRLGLAEGGNRVTGVLDVAAGGYGFVAPEQGGEDIFITQRDLAGALDGDTVLVEVTGRGRGKGRGPRGQVIKVLRRGRTHLVGTYHEQEGRGFIIPDGDLSNLRVAVERGEVGRLNERDKVVVQLPPPEPDMVTVTGRVVEVLGKSGAVGVDELSVIREFELRDRFPDQVHDEAAKVSERLDDARGRDRRDIRDWLTITIDPEEARDFDDAISIRKRDGGGWQLGVHIADVSRFVLPGSALDEEARKRGTSVYFPGFAIPMLPEELSSDVCSLRPREDRLTKTVYMTFDAHGRLLGEEVWPSLIRSDARLSYVDAGHILQGKTGGFPREVVELVREAEALAKALNTVRIDRGALELDIPELEVVVDENGWVERIEPKVRTWAHRLIEEAMVAANESVARLMQREELPAVYRNHGDPDPEEVADFLEFAKSLGFSSRKHDLRRRLQEILAKADETALAYTVHLALLKSTQRAVYAAACEGHFALASESYCHFTSPIRRYPDLLVHQVLDAWWQGGLEQESRRAALREEIPGVAAEATEAERTGDAAEGAITEVKILRYLLGHADRTFTGVITGVLRFGVFVRLDRLIIEGLIPVSGLPGDRYRLVERRHQLVGAGKDNSFRLGERVEVRIGDIDLAARQLQLTFVRKLSAAKRKPSH